VYVDLQLAAQISVDDPIMGWSRYAQTMAILLLSPSLAYYAPTHEAVALATTLAFRMGAISGSGPISGPAAISGPGAISGRGAISGPGALSGRPGAISSAAAFFGEGAGGASAEEAESQREAYGLTDEVRIPSLEPRMRLTVRGVRKGALRTHSA